MDNFKFNFLSCGQLESLSIKKSFFVQIIKPCCESCFDTLILAIIAWMFCGNHLKWVMDKTLTPSPWTTLMDYPNGLP